MIRVITEADSEVFRALRLRALAEEPESFGADAEAFAATALPDVAARLHATNDTFVLGAFMPTLVGMVGFVREQGGKKTHKAFIWGMYVAPEARGQGIGRSLMAEALTRAVLLPGLEQVHIGVVTTNTAAVALYRSLGFTTYGTESRALKIGDRYVDEELMVRFTESPALPAG